MDSVFKRSRLAPLNKDQLISIIRHPQNAVQFGIINIHDLEAASTESLINLILSKPDAHLDNNVWVDLHHQSEAAAFTKLEAAAREHFRQRQAYLQGLAREQLLHIVSNPYNTRFIEDLVPALPTFSKEQLLDILTRYPEMSLTGNPQDRSYNPDHWVPKPNQVEHIERLITGLTSPANEARCAWDASKTGKGKTVSAIRAAIGLKVRYLLIVCPGQVVRKWHEALRPLGLFDYKICSYDGIKGTTKTAVRWARYKPDPFRTEDLEDLPWVQIRSTGLSGINDAVYDWSFLPGTDPTTGLGGCMVIWDEVHHVKGVSKNNTCFRDFIRALHGHQDKIQDFQRNDPNKYVRGLFLSGTIMEKVSDLPYIMYALGYIPDATVARLNGFMREQLTSNFRALMGPSWKPKYEKIDASTEEGKKEKLLLFLRNVAGRQNKFSQIPEPLEYVLHRLKLIPEANAESLAEFVSNTLVPNFRRAMADEWREELESLSPDQKLIRFLTRLAKDPKYSNIPIADVINKTFENPITFQGLQIRDEELGQFIRINREIEAMLLEVVRGNKKFDGGILGQIQRTLSELEVLKLTPFTELARKILSTPLPNGAKPSVAFAFLRNASVRHMAWRLEAIMMIEQIKELGYGVKELENIRINAIASILKEYNAYIEREQRLDREGLPLPIMSMFQRYSPKQLMELSFEDLLNEYIKWTYYLDIHKFQHVCIFVGDIGMPASSDYDIESEDANDRVKESRPLKQSDKADMLSYFQTNSRRIMLTNIQIAGEGIDLHDTSRGGMHPRTAIISPGITARYLVQMLGRFEREGQTSESLRIIGYVDNVKGIQSWEARFMAKLSMKVKDLQLLHQGTVSLDIEENIESDGRSILTQIIDEMRMGVGYNIQDAPAIVDPLSPVDEQPVSGGRTSSPGGKPDAVTALFQKTLGKSRTLVQGPGSMLPAIELPSRPIRVQAVDEKLALIMQVNSSHIYFHSRKAALVGFVERIINVLTSLKVDPYYYKVIGIDNPRGPGILIYRPGFAVAGILQTEMLARIEEAVAVPLAREDVDEQYFEAEKFTPPVRIVELLVVFDSPLSFYIGPGYPIQSKLPKEILNLATITDAKPGIIKIQASTTARLIVIFYAIKMIALFEAPGIFQSFRAIDPRKVFESLDRNLVPKLLIRDGKVVLAASADIIRSFGLILGAFKQLIQPIRNGQVMDLKSYQESSDGSTASVVIQPASQELFTRLLGKPAEAEEEKK